MIWQNNWASLQTKGHDLLNLKCKFKKYFLKYNLHKVMHIVLRYVSTSNNSFYIPEKMMDIKTNSYVVYEKNSYRVYGNEI